MHEILKRLPRGARVLDLGCAGGSFRDEDTDAAVVRCDLDPRVPQGADAVRADARQLPFTARSFDAVILNHSLEHFLTPDAVLAEIGRVVREDGSLWVAVPDASTLTDRIYRWLGRGGGHVNFFRDASELVALVERETGLRHIGTRVLFTSLSFLNRRNFSARAPRRLWLLGGGAEWVVRWGTFLLRRMDRVFGTQLAVYGWGCCFGRPLVFDSTLWTNVCVRCGAGVPAERLMANGGVRRRWFGVRAFACPSCGAENYFTDDAA